MTTVMNDDDNDADDDDGDADDDDDDGALDRNPTAGEAVDRGAAVM